jgi:hypothetical protein
LRRWPRVGAAAVLLLLALDLGEAARGLHPTSPREQLETKTELIPYLNALPQPSRTLQLSLDVPSGLLPAFGVEQLFGAEFLYPVRRAELFERANELGIWEKMMPVFAVPYELWPEGALRGHPHEAELELMTTLDGVDVYRNAGAMPRAYLLNTLEVAPDADALFARMAEPDFDPKTMTITEAAFRAEPMTGTGDAGTATVREIGLSSMVLDVDATGAAVLVVSETYYPGWTASIDGEPAKIIPVYHALRGVIVPEGRHEVMMRYEPGLLKAGLGLSFLGMIASCAASLWLLRWIRTSA